MSEESAAGGGQAHPSLPILSQAWREHHVREGDVLLEHAAIALTNINWDKAHVLAALAQAHYAAANVRAKVLQ